MEFQTVFNKIKGGLTDIDTSKLDRDFAVQVNLTGEGEGAFYIANKNGEFQVEPYTYNDRNGAVTVDCALLAKILAGEASAEANLALGKIKIEGNPSALLKVFAASKEAREAKKKAEVKSQAEAKPQSEAKSQAEAKSEVKPQAESKPQAETKSEEKKK